uniref:CCHC-type domain-containing protein n=1 Tax=Oryza rufipogon TaxID=4529 RepID=A0A0E0RA03_ORYRU
MFFSPGWAKYLQSRIDNPVARTQEAQTGTAESVLTEDGPDVPLSDSHIAKDCPEKHNRNAINSLHFMYDVENQGPDMFGYANDYPRDDVKKGHLCCADFSDICPKEVVIILPNLAILVWDVPSNVRREASTAATPTLCYKCGEEGYFARGCTKNTKTMQMTNHKEVQTQCVGFSIYP